MSRLGIQPLGFGDTIVLLTAAHFHYAGFAAPILTGLAGRILSDAPSTTRRLFVVAGIAITIGTPIVATGITVSPVLALVGTLIISLGLALLSERHMQRPLLFAERVQAVEREIDTLADADAGGAGELIAHWSADC